MSSGGVFYFNNLKSQNLTEGEFLDVYVPASHGITPPSRNKYKNVDSDEQQTYYGMICYACVYVYVWLIKIPFVRIFYNQRIYHKYK